MRVPWRAVGQHSAITDFEVRVDGFDGPLDLLLELIERQGLDITGVSVLAVTDQFLAYAQKLETSYADAASEFLLVGSQLLLLKSRALLPAQEDELKEETADDLAARLRMYAAFKAVAADLSALWESGATSFIRAATPVLAQPPVEPGTGDLESLIEALATMAAATDPAEEKISIPRLRISIADRMQEIRHRLGRDHEVDFSVITANCHSRDELVATFIALLHLIVERHVHVSQNGPFSEITLRWTENGHAP